MKGVLMSKSKIQEIKDLKKIIKIQERIIQLKENEFQMVHKLFMHYLRRYEEFQHKYIFHRKLWLHSVNDFNDLVKHIREFDNAGSVDDLKQRLKEVDSGGTDE
jgi:hypothetical protein